MSEYCHKDKNNITLRIQNSNRPDNYLTSRRTRGSKKFQIVTQIDCVDACRLNMYIWLMD